MLDIPQMREVVRKLTKLLAGKNVTVTQVGTGAYVAADPKTHEILAINIPYIPDNASQEFVFAIQGFIDHEIGHVLHTDFGQYQAHDPRLQMLNNLVEDVLIERLMAKTYAGSGYNLNRLGEYFVTNISDPALRLPQVKGNNAREFDVILVPAIRALAGQPAFDDWMTKHGYWKHPLVEALTKRLPSDFQHRLKTITKTHQSVELAKILNEILYPKPKKSSTPAPSEEDTKKAEEEASSFERTEFDENEPKEKGEDKGKAGESDAEEDEGETGKGAGEGEGTNDKEKDDDGDDDADGGSEDRGEDEAQSSDDGGTDADGSSEGSEPGDSGKEDQQGAGSSGADRGSDAGDDDSAASASDEAQDVDAESKPDPSHSLDDGEDKKADDEEGAEEGEADGKTETVKAPQKRQDSVGTDDDPGEAKEAKGGGIGDGGNPFQEHKPDLTNKDFADQLAAKIGEQASRFMGNSPYRCYTKDNDVIEKVKVRSNFDDRIMTDMEDKTRRIAGTMQKDIERLMASRSQVLNIPGFRAGKLHAGSLHRVTQGDDRVFRRKKENKSKDTAVSLVCDLSGSMHGQKLDTAMMSAFSLSQTLERCGIVHEVLGFTTHNTSMVFGWGGGSDEFREKYDADVARMGKHYNRIEPIYMPIFKEFHERLTPEVKRRFAAGTTNGGTIANCSNVDGESVETAVLRLRQRSEARKVAIVLSDGEPATASYGSDRGALHRHLRMVIENAEKNGVEMIGIGILSDAVRNYYPKHIVLKAVEDLPGALMGQLRSILLK